MNHFSYRRHFGMLAVGLIGIFLLSHWDLLKDQILVTFAINGAVHASSLALSLRTPITIVRKLLFIALAAVLSVFTLYIGIVGLVLFAVLPATERLYFVLGLCAVSGAITYALLIRLFWFKKFPSRSILAMAVACMFAVFGGFFARTHFEALDGWALAGVWWFAFSGGLWYFDSSRR
jgi:hypothetical protein